MKDFEKLIEYIKNSKRIVFFGGAGTSTESGLKDFRSKDGLYNENYSFPPEEILSHHFFMDNTEEFYRFYKDKLNSLEYQPNITHIVLSKLENKGILSAVITQNIDGFHTSAGSKNVFELHGTIMKNHCMDCNKEYDASYVFSSKGIPKCNCGGIIKPDVVLYEEGLNQEVLMGAVNEIINADLLIIGGTSLAVYPAAGLIDYTRAKHIVLINKDKTDRETKADLVIHKGLGEVFKQIEKELNL